MTGRHNFLEAAWGPIEPWDDCLPVLLRHARGTYSHMITDHYHYFHSGGEAYHTLFDSWELQRGQEGDRWRPLVSDVSPPNGVRGKAAGRSSYWKNESLRDKENDLDYSGPQCFAQAIEFLKHNRDADNWHLHLEVFDPHEPFDCPAKYHELYQDDWDDYFYTWPDYAPLDPEKDTPEAVEHIKKSYAATLTMNDHWLGRFLDTMDAYDLWNDVSVVFTADHGFLLGEHGYWAKDYTMAYEELAHTPLIVCPAGGPSAAAPAANARGEEVALRRVDALTAAIDIMPTIMDMHGVESPRSVHGSSLLPLLTGTAGSHHDAVLFGTFGMDINMTDGRYTYCRQPLPGSVAYHHTAMPRNFHDFYDRDLLRSAEVGVFLDHCCGVPHFRFGYPSKPHVDAPDFNPIYDLDVDPRQEHPIQDSELERRLAQVMRQKMMEAGAPISQYQRVGLEPPKGSSRPATER